MYQICRRNHFTSDLNVHCLNWLNDQRGKKIGKFRRDITEIVVSLSTQRRYIYVIYMKKRNITHWNVCVRMNEMMWARLIPFQLIVCTVNCIQMIIQLPFSRLSEAECVRISFLFYSIWFCCCFSFYFYFDSVSAVLMSDLSYSVCLCHYIV